MGTQQLWNERTNEEAAEDYKILYQEDFELNQSPSVSRPAGCQNLGSEDSARPVQRLLNIIDG